MSYRTDYYSFGVSCYEILSGQPPFHADDPLEMVHHHLAKPPTPLNDLQPEIPQGLNDVVLKLMAKTMEDRYQSAPGLKHDLQHCQHEWVKYQRIPAFQLGQHDIAERFQVSDKLYGRHDDLVKLLEAFDRVSDGGVEMMLVTGFSGIGKTALINQVHKPITRQRGYFIKGKFDQFQRDIPFSAFRQALQMLIRQLLAEDEAEQQAWKTTLLTALGQNAQIMIDLIPELQTLIDPQPAAPTLEGEAAANRFHLFFCRFVRVFSTQQHPLVIFLDDLCSGGSSNSH